MGISSYNVYHVVTSDGNSAETILDGFTISGGAATGANGDGGGMLASYSWAKLDNIVFQQNSAENNGGGLSSSYSGLILDHVTFDQNSANNKGGGLYDHQGALKLTNVNFTSNSAIAWWWRI